MGCPEGCIKRLLGLKFPTLAAEACFELFVPKTLFPFHIPCSVPLIVDLLDNKELLETCIDNTTDFPPAGGSAEALEQTGLGFTPLGTKEQPSDKADPVGKEMPGRMGIIGTFKIPAYLSVILQSI